MKLPLGVETPLVTFEDEDMGRVIKQEDEFLLPPTLTLHPCPSTPWNLGQPESRRVTRKRGLEDEKRTRGVGKVSGDGERGE